MKDKSVTASKIRKKYSSEFKEQVLKRVEKDGVTLVARDLGLAASMIYSWKACRLKTGIPFEDQKIQSAEMARMRRENLRLSQENAFLKKATAYFAKEQK